MCWHISPQGGMNMVMHAIEHAWGEWNVIPKIPSYKITDVAEAAPECTLDIIGIRPGEKNLKKWLRHQTRIILMI
jgi:FlaA1/EpsC-like NDP-sugar epimerase